MTLFRISIYTALAINLLLAFLVFFRNTRRAANQHFLTLSVAAGAWLACMAAGAATASPVAAVFWMRVCSALAPLVLTTFMTLRLSIVHPSENWFRVMLRARWWLLFNTLIALLCSTEFFIQGAKPLRPDQMLHEPIYGSGLYPYIGYWVIAFVMLVYGTVRDVRRLTGIQRVELQFTLMGYGAGLFVGICVMLVIPLLTGSMQSAQLGPFSVTFLDGMVAYGVATRRIMGAADVLIRVVGLLLLIAYLSLLYTAVWWTCDHGLAMLTAPKTGAAHVLAAIAVVLAVVPANGLVQRFAHRTFAGGLTLDVGRTMQQAHQILRSIDTLDGLLTRLAELISESLGTERVAVFLRDGDAYAQRYPATAAPVRLEPGDAIPAEMGQAGDPLVLDALRRMRPSPRLAEAQQRLTELGAQAAVAIHYRGRIEGIVLLGPRRFGRIYGATEQDALQLLCDQIGVSLENARLYTTVQEGKIYNDILLDQLASGIVAANAMRVVTVFNREACRITGLEPAAVLNQPVDVLPSPLAMALHRTFAAGVGLRDLEADLPRSSEDTVPVRMSTATFGPGRDVIGALLLFSDLTALRRLEAQLRRSDRLASLGTLSAGMAHEIKNPLVALKTFTQLLPERYEDADFRATFTSIVGQEVQRIDRIVNQLLNFARPAKPVLCPMHLHDAVEGTLRLIDQPLRQKQIALVRAFAAPDDTVRGDANLMGQVFLNILLNAIESMEVNGQLQVASRVINDDAPAAAGIRGTATDGKYIQVSIRDTGRGIAAENLPHVFDPFFTTRSEGTGLGLSIAHGIVREHGGTIDVESEEGRGATFHVIVPLCGEGATA